MNDYGEHMDDYGKHMDDYGKRMGHLTLTLLFSSSSFIPGRHVHNSVGIDIKRHFNLRNTSGSGWNANLNNKSKEHRIQ